MSDRLIAKAVADEADKYAPSTLDKARSSRSKANTILTSDRYNRTETLVLAAKAEYEAQHASSISVWSLVALPELNASPACIMSTHPMPERPVAMNGTQSQPVLGCPNSVVVAPSQNPTSVTSFPASIRPMGEY